jgi:hypothetical protein
MTETEDPLAFLLRLNLDCAAKEAENQPITPPASPNSSPTRPPSPPATA